MRIAGILPTVRKAASATAVMLLLAGCANKPLDVPYNPSNFGPPDPQEIAKSPEQIEPGDKIKVTVFQVELPIGRVSGRGKRRDQLPAAWGDTRRRSDTVRVGESAYCAPCGEQPQEP